MLKLFLYLPVILVFIVNIAVAGENYDLIVGDRAHLYKAISFVKQKNYALARREAAKAKDDDILQLILWYQYQDDFADNNYKEIVSFINDNPSIPNKTIMLRQAERTLNHNTSAEMLIKYFSTNEPLTGHGMQLLAEAKIKTLASKEEVNNYIRKTWIESDFPVIDEKKYLKKYSDILREKDHVEKIDRLLWENKITSAKRIVGKVSGDYQRLFTARIYLNQKQKGVDYAVSHVSEKLSNDPGLLYDRINWHQRRENHNRVYDALKDFKTTMPYQNKWWDMKNLLIRELIKNNKYDLAYNIASNNGNVKGSSDYADAKWISGWLALTYLNNPKIAYEHFYDMYNNVNFPVSKSRAAYWAARAAEADNNINIAESWYKIASKSNTTFYGQLAHSKIYDNKLFSVSDLPSEPNPKIDKYNSNRLAKIAVMLTILNEDNDAEKFITAAIDEIDGIEEMYLISRLGVQMNEPKLSVIAAKHALKKDVVLTETGWPIIENIPNEEVENALVLGIIRQESRFDKNARSSANALGLMQIIPPTAKQVAKKLGVKYSEDDLTKNPEYNILLGSRYISHLVNHFDGSYILAIASYNAGPTNVKRWIKMYGDPRKMTSNHQIINWIEHIPFQETRNYVQRIIENIQVYRYLLNKQSLSIEEDLLR